MFLTLRSPGAIILNLIFYKIILNVNEKPNVFPFPSAFIL